MRALLPLVLLGGLLGAQSVQQRFVHRYDVRIRENNRYLGLQYGGGRGVIRREAGPNGEEIVVDYLIQEETMRNQINVEKFLEQEVYFRYPAQGLPRGSAAPRYPFHEGYPTLPPEGVQPGSVWTGQGFWTVRPRRDRPATRVPVLIEYREAGTGVWANRPAIVVTGLYALRYRRGQDAGGDPDLSSLQGRHEMTLYLDLQTQRPFFMRLKLTENYTWADGTTRLHEGFHLIWMEDAAPLPPIPTLPRTVAAQPPGTSPDLPPVTPPHAATLDPTASRPSGPGTGPSVPGPGPGGPSPTGGSDRPSAADQPAAVATLPQESPRPVPPETAGERPSTGAGPGGLAPLPLPAEPEVSVRQTDRGIILVPENLLFVADRADLLPNQESKLLGIVRLLQSQPDRSVLVVGHTADVGRPAEELSLSRERAQRVAALLVQLGVDGGRIFMEGRGSRDPRVPNTTEAQRALNRRVEIILRND